MERQEIPFEQFRTNIFPQWDKRWLLLSAGSFADNKFNSMTVGWGAFGVMWAKPMAMIVVRPQRYTMDFLEKNPEFTLCAFPAEYQQALRFCGAKSGRDVPEKAATAGLHAEASALVSAPSFVEAELAVECRKVFRSDMCADQLIPAECAAEKYPGGDFHRIFFGEIVRISGTAKYLA